MTDGKKTVLFVMPRLPFPASSGRKTSLYITAGFCLMN